MTEKARLKFTEEAMTSYERSNFVTEAVTVGNGFKGDSEDFGGVWKWAESVRFASAGSA